MRRISLLCLATLVFAAEMSFGISRGPEMSEHEMTALKACEGIVRLVESSAGQIWPGFDLSRRPFLVYIPGRWALLINPPEGAKEFGPLPADWPPLRIRAGYFSGQYRDLVGQLAFDLDVGGAKIVAIGLLEDQFGAAGPKTPTVLGLIVHEAFHQYQNEAFGEIPWEREERYPILDADNTALAALEMRILADAISASLADRRAEAEDLIRRFVAVRTARWEKSPAFVSRYETGQEIREGTAAFVEKKSMELARGLQVESGLKGRTTSLRQDLEPFPVAEIFRRDFEGRTTADAVSPDDMIRNRIYPVGSALGYLADIWGSGWKQDLAQAVGTFTFHGYFKDKMRMRAEDLAPLLEDAKKHYGYSAIRQSAAGLISSYRAGFEKDLAAFEAQSGTRLEVRLRYRSISRSRSSQGRSWVADDGAKTLLTKVRVYALKTDGLALQVTESAIYEQNDWDAKDKGVALFTPSLPVVVLDGAKKMLGRGPDSFAFREIEMTAPNLTLTAKIPGVIKVENGRVTLEFHVTPPAK